MNMVIELSKSYLVVNCYTCGVDIVLAESHFNGLKKYGSDFFCPNGHAQTMVEKCLADVIKKKKKL